MTAKGIYGHEFRWPGSPSACGTYRPVLIAWFCEESDLVWDPLLLALISLCSGHHKQPLGSQELLPRCWTKEELSPWSVSFLSVTAPPLPVMDMLNGYPHNTGVLLYPHRLQPHQIQHINPGIHWKYTPKAWESEFLTEPQWLGDLSPRPQITVGKTLWMNSLLILPWSIWIVLLSGINKH